MEKELKSQQRIYDDFVNRPSKQAEITGRRKPYHMTVGTVKAIGKKPVAAVKER